MFQPGDAVFINERPQIGDRFPKNTLGRVERIEPNQWVRVGVPQIDLSRILGYAIEVEALVKADDCTLLTSR